MSWWQQPYPGGPMVAVKGFPRPLHYNAKGYPNSIDGSDVEAYKRVVSRAGRWKWQAFDQAYSKAFSAGKPPGNVSESGVTGVQRQGNIQPTGQLGRETFDLLRSIRIPEGLPHAGEAAMDARSVELINAAYQRFGGSEPTGPQGSSAATARLQKAVGELGVTESPPGSNQTVYGNWYGSNGVPWCAIFCTWADLTSKPPAASFAKGSRWAYVPYIVSDARLGLNGLSITSSPKPGDLVCYDWSRDGEYDHVGIFESGNASSWTAVEGNTSTSDNSNGGQVMRRTRTKHDAAVVFVRVKEP